MPAKRVEEWLKGDRVPTPLIDAIIKRPTLLRRPYREAVLNAVRQEIANRRTPEAVVDRIVQFLFGEITPPIAKNVPRQATKNVLTKRYRGGEK